MAKDETSHILLQKGEPAAPVARPLPKPRTIAGTFIEVMQDPAWANTHHNETPIGKEQWRDDLKTYREADAKRQTEHERVVREVLALAPDAPDGFATLFYSYPWLAAYLLPVFAKANADAEG